MTKDGCASGERDPWKIGDSRSLLPFFLVVLAGTFPALFMLRRNPDFLKAHGLSLIDGLGLFAILFLLLPLSLFLPALLLDRLSRTHWAWRGLVFLSCFVFLMALFTALPPWISILVALFCAWLITEELEQSPRICRWMMKILVPAWLASGLMFWLSEDVAQAFPSGVSGLELRQVKIKETEVPVIFLLFDELPLTILMTPEGEIDERHFPNFADLSRHSTWYRVARSPSAETMEAVPKIVSGTLEPLPTRESLLTLFQQSHRVERFDDVVAIAPPTSSAQPKKLLRTLLDFRIIYLHLITPEAWRSFLPAVDQSWKDFGTTERRYQQAYSSLQRIEGGQPPLFFFAHYLLPHGPYRYREQGALAAPSFLPESASMLEEVSFRQFFLQVKAVDELLGVALERLKREGLWNSCLLVVVADHGISFNPEVNARSTEGEAAYETLYVPFFLRSPRQEAGVKVDTPVSLLDVLPLMLAALGGEDPWDFDGRVPKVQQSDRTTLETLLRLSAEKYRRFDLEGPASVYGPPWLSSNWARVPPGVQGTVPDLACIHINQPLFQDVDLSQSALPLNVEIEVQGAVSAGSALIVVINGVVASSSERFLTDLSESERRFLTLPIPEHLLQDGLNSVEVLLLDQVDGKDRWRAVASPDQEEIRYLPEGVLLVGEQRHSVRPGDLATVGYQVQTMGSGSCRVKIIPETLSWDEVLVVPVQGGLPRLRRMADSTTPRAPLILATGDHSCDFEGLLVLVKTRDGYIQATRVKDS